MVNVRCGSKADISECPRNVRFTPEIGHPTQSLIHSFNERRIVVRRGAPIAWSVVRHGEKVITIT
jgi:hypothetical protein